MHKKLSPAMCGVLFSLQRHETPREKSLRLMIWDSTFAMTAIGVLMMSIIGSTLWILYKRKDTLRVSGAISGAPLIVLGMALFGTFYFLNLITMYGLSLFIPREDAMVIMGDLHLDLSWRVALAGMGSIVAGFLLNNKHMFSLIGRLETTKRRLVEEIVEHNKVEEALHESEERHVRAEVGFRIDEIV